MSFFREMDLYKLVILVSGLLLPVTGWWINHSMQEIAVAQKAVADAPRLLERIGKTRSDLDMISHNAVSAGDEPVRTPETYFETQIVRSAGGRISTSDFKVTKEKEDRVAQHATDWLAKIDFPRKGNKGLEITREILFAVLFNCESGAKGKDVPTQSIWKLQQLEVVNATSVAQEKFTSHKAPPSELEDLWSLTRSIYFVRREPLKDKK